jgi:hypothetical protein
MQSYKLNSFLINSNERKKLLTLQPLKEPQKSVLGHIIRTLLKYKKADPEGLGRKNFKNETRFRDAIN